MMRHRKISNMESSQAMDELKQHISGSEPVEHEVKDQKFESTLDHYYNKVDECQSLKDDQELFEQKVNEKIGQNSLNYFH